MNKNYIEVKIPILDSVEEMEVVKTFNEEQLWYVCAIAKAFENNEQENTTLKKGFDEIKEIIITHKRKDDNLYLNEWQTREILQIIDKVLGGSK